MGVGCNNPVQVLMLVEGLACCYCWNFVHPSAAVLTAASIGFLYLLLWTSTSMPSSYLSLLVQLLSPDLRSKLKIRGHGGHIWKYLSLFCYRRSIS